MWRYITVFLLVLSFTGCKNDNNKKLPADIVNNPSSASGNDKSIKSPRITFEKTEHSFGEIIQGEVVSYRFKFENTGNAELIIARVSTSCGCTVSDYSTDPIKPGESSSVAVKFDSKNRLGFQNKRITVLSNAIPARKDLHIKAEIRKPGQ